MGIKKHWVKALFLLCLVFVLYGCAEIDAPGAREIMSQPLGEMPLRIGMTKEEVLSIWGKPDSIASIESTSPGAIMEEWIYRGRYPDLPINVDYLSESQHLIFDGKHLVKHYHER